MYSLLLATSAFIGLLGSIVLGASSGNLLGVWLCMEINMLMFSALLSFSKVSDEPQALKYFLIQSMGSAAMVAWIFSVAELSTNISSSIIFLSMVLKLGLAPLHSWFISLVANISWENVMLLSTIQKVLPLIVVGQVYSVYIMTVLISASIIVGILGSIGQVETKKLLGYSSVFNGAWMISVSYSSPTFWGFMALYSVSFLVCVFLLSYSVSSMHICLWSNSSLSTAMILLAFLSLGGVPPMIGFYAKLLVVMSLLYVLDVFVVSVLVLSSVLLTYVYLRLIYTKLSLMMASPTTMANNFVGWGSLMVVTPSMALFFMLCGGVCMGNFGFPGLIWFSHMSIMVVAVKPRPALLLSFLVSPSQSL